MRPRVERIKRKKSSTEARVDDEALFRDHPAVVGGQKQRHARDLLREQDLRQALPSDDRLNVGLAQP